MQQQINNVEEFAELADAIGPFCKLTALKELLDGAPQEVRKTTMWGYLHGIFDARSLYDNTCRNDLGV
ncbi:MAG: hypothetical protein V3573_13160 [Desulfovibrionaceae bacterium]